MSSKTKMDVFNFIYILGMALVIVGFFMPIFSVSGLLSGKHTANGFTILQKISEKNVTLRVCDLLVFIGAVAGVIFGFIPEKTVGKFILNLLKLVAFLATAGAGIYFFFNYGASFSKNFIDTGFYLIVAGWAIALVGGWFTSK